MPHFPFDCGVWRFGNILPCPVVQTSVSVGVTVSGLAVPYAQMTPRAERGLKVQWSDIMCGDFDELVGSCLPH